MKTRAAVLPAQGAPLQLVELDIAPPGPGEVRIRLVASGVCRSDFSVTTGVLRSPLPVVLGHEAAGVVEEIGEGVSEIEVADRVVVALTPACGQCLFCQEGAPNRCVEMVPVQYHFATSRSRTAGIRTLRKVVLQAGGV